METKTTNTDTAGSPTYKIERKTTEYDSHRYSRPWIARVDFSKSPHGVYIWGDWIGEDSRSGVGKPGVLTIQAHVGDVIAVGQKDYHGKVPCSDYGLVQPDGNVKWCDDKGEAYRLWSELRKAQAPASNQEPAFGTFAADVAAAIKEEAQ